MEALGTKCLASAVTGSAPALENHFAPQSSKKLGLQPSEFVGPFSLRRTTFFLGSSSKGRPLNGRRNSSARWSQAGFGTTTVGQLQEDSEQDNTHKLHFPGESNRSRRSSENGATENSSNILGNEGEGGGVDGADRHDAQRPNFRMGRRMLLGLVSVGISAAYRPSASSGGAQAADSGFKFALNKGSWFLGDSEASMAAEGLGEGGEEKEELGVGERESRVYDATVLGEPVVLGNDNKERCWTRLLENRVVYLGEAETVEDSDDKLLELEIVRTLRDRCFAQQRSLSLAFQAFPCSLQPQLNAYMNKKLTDQELRETAFHWPENQWLEYLPILKYCRKNGVRLIACGAPLEVLRTVQAKGVQALSKADRQKYVPSPGGGYKFKSSPLDNSGFMDNIPNQPGLYGPGPYRFAQSRIIEDYDMAQVVSQIISEGGAVGLLLVVAGASHVQYGARGTGLPAWIAKNRDMQKRTQAVVLLNPERQYLREEGDVPHADFLWYSAAKVCKRNCFDRAEVARVIDAAGRSRDALPKDLQMGLKQGLVAPEVLQSFFELEQNPVMAALTGRFQGLRERWLADPRFLQRLAIEETISITTTLIAQYERRGSRFWQEIDYVATDSIRGAVVDFFTVWLPAPRLSFREVDPHEAYNALDSLNGLLGSFPDNAFQRPSAGENWGAVERVGGILVGGLKLFGVGFISSIGTLAGTNLVLAARQYFSPQVARTSGNKRSPVLKTALVYGAFLGTSANLRYQIIAGVVEHWVADYWLASQPLAGNVISFVARTANSYFGTGQWVDLARFTGLQAHNDETEPAPSAPTLTAEAELVHDSEHFSAVSSSISGDVGTDNGSLASSISTDNGSHATESTDPTQETEKASESNYVSLPED